jgi:hypothetical protein
MTLHVSTGGFGFAAMGAAACAGAVMRSKAGVIAAVIAARLSFEVFMGAFGKDWAAFV